jgi:L-histidine N-alpha-methyltransferase
MILHEPVPLPSYIDEVVHGLTSRPKTLPCKLFYDDRGSQLFEEITRLPEYYPTRTELGILQDSAKEIVRAAGTPVSIVELGAGTATKTTALLHAVARRQLRVKYFPVDISAGALADAKARIKDECQNVTVLP